MERIKAYRIAGDSGEIIVCQRSAGDGIDLQVASFGSSTAVTLSWEQIDDIVMATSIIRLGEAGVSL